ncbi:MAG: sugar ABC transporter permease [Clostridiales bacterium]|jgi:multiple sugar transport system permease protein|nr:sugar ABC transporter permease [Clostridiales bacterium]
MSDANGGFAGIENFINLFQNRAFLTAIKNTFNFMAAAIPLNIIIPVIAGTLMFSVNSGSWLRAVFISPLVIPSACVAFFFQTLFMPNGFINSFLGLETDWVQTGQSFWVAVGIYIWRNMGYNLVLTLAGLAGIPKGYYEWASVEGMGKIRMFFNITLIYLTPSLFIMAVMSFINSFKVYRELYMLAGSYPQEKIYMLQHYMNNQFSSLNYQNLTAASFVVTSVISIAVVIFFLISRKQELGE